MRIISGRNRGLRLTALGSGDSGINLRPTSDRVRESLFNMLQNRLDFEGLVVLDLFAGTGALGLEAISRGAGYVTFVEQARFSQKIIKQNIDLLKCSERSKLLTQDATKLSPGKPCDLVFLDPPYGKNLGESALNSAVSQGWIMPGTFIVFEDSTNSAPNGFHVEDTRKFGGTTITLLTAICSPTILLD